MVTTFEGYVVSVATHAALIGAAYLSGITPPPVIAEVPDSFKWVEYLIPKDRNPASRAVKERLTFVGLAAPGGQGQIPADTREPERLAVVKPEGVARDDLAEPAAPPAPAPELPGDSVLTVLEVDSAAARYDESAAPPYPATMLKRGLGGTVAVQYVVDTTGLADTTSFIVLSTTHADFARSVRSTLPYMRFHPAMMNSRKVRQLVQQLFTFKIDSTALLPARKPTERQ